MNPIVFPLTPGMQGTQVADLHAALHVVLDRGVILGVDDGARAELREGLRREGPDQDYQDATQQVVALFQEARRLEPVSGEVDEGTANALNAILRETGLLDRGAGGERDRPFVVGGRVLRADGVPPRGGRVRADHTAGGGTLRLGDAITDADGRYTIRYDPLPGAASVVLRVSVVAEDGREIAAADPRPNAAPVEIVDLSVPVTEAPPAERRVEGRIVLDHGLPAAGMTVRLYRREFGGGKTELAKTTTLEGGVYALPYAADGTPLSLEISAGDGDAEVPLATALHPRDDGERTALNLIAPGALQPLAAEYGRLTEALTPHLGDGGIANLATAQETADRREGDRVVSGRKDLTVLNRATGWDARLIALAATAEKLGADAAIGLPPKALYGLFRAGLPQDPLQLAQVDPGIVDKALAKMRDDGFVDFTDDDVTATNAAFATFRRDKRLSVPAPGSRSTYGDLLAGSGLAADQQQAFADAFLDRPDGADIWQRATDAGLDDGQVRRLQTQGKLAFLAANSAPLTALLQTTVADPADLAGQDFDLAGTWEATVRAAAAVAPDIALVDLPAADHATLRGAIPAAYLADLPADDQAQLLAGTVTELAKQILADGVQTYTEDMARKVRVSYPTQVVGQIVERDVDDRFGLGPARAATAALLKSAPAHGFRLGQTPVAGFFADHPQALAALPEADRTPALETAKTVQRLYQITPGNDAMTTLMERGFTSAHEVTATTLETFLRRHGHAFPSPKQAELVYRKAQQVSAVTHALFTAAQAVETDTPTYGASGTLEDRVAEQTAVKSALIKRFPTMKQLFGSLDFCECEHCRSVLSPAAYLVDLLQILDRSPKDWADFVVAWDEDHQPRRYADRYVNPYDALIARRPDIPHIPLTCENTQTALPYIDLVNEILEFFVANKGLTKDAARDTGAATTAELLAEPGHVLDGAYKELAAASYPLTLPFDLWLETVRRFADQFETPLWRMLELLRPTDALVAADKPYDYAAIFAESLDISPRERDLFGAPNPLADDAWFDLYGYPRDRSAIANPTNVERATLTLPDEDAAALHQGFVVATLDAAGALRPGTKSIAEIGLAGSGGDGQTLVTLAGIWDISPNAGDQLVVDPVAMLASATTLSHRLGVTYKELLAVVETGFVNPDLAEMVVMAKLDLSVRDVFAFRDHKAELDELLALLASARNALNPADQARHDQFEADKTWPIPQDLLAKARAALDAAGQERVDYLTSGDRRDALNEAHAITARLDRATTAHAAVGFDGQGWLNGAIQDNRFARILVLRDEKAECDFDATTLEYADGTAADAIAFWKINLFVRLWRKLGWTIAETDQALRAFVPKPAADGTPFDAAHLAQSPLATALLFLAHLKNLDARVPAGERSRLKWPSLWGDLATVGPDALYAQLFLNRAVLRHDPVFDHPLGQYLSEESVAAQAGAHPFRVSEENVEAGDALDPAAFAAQPNLKGIAYDPRFRVQSLTYVGAPTDAEAAQIAALSPSPVLPRLLDAARAAAAAFKTVKGHQPAIQGALGLTAAEVGAVLRDADKNPETEPLSLPAVSLLFRYRLLANALGLPVGDLIALKKLAKRDPFAPLPAAAPATLEEDTPFSQTLDFVAVAQQVTASGFTVEGLRYLLRHQFEESGPHRPDPAADRAAVKTLADGIRAIRVEQAVPADAGAIGEDALRQKLGLILTPEVVDRFLAMLNLNGTRRDDPTDEERAFFRTYLQKAAPGTRPESGFLGFLDDADFEDLVAPIPAPPEGLTPDEAREREQTRRREVLGTVSRAFLPFLERRLVRQFVVQTTTTQLGIDPALGEALMTDDRLLGTPAPLAEALTGAADRGVDVTFLGVDGADLLPATTVADADTRLIAEKPANTAGVRIVGELDVPTPGVYRFFVVLDKQNAVAKLAVDGRAAPVLDGTAANDRSEIAGGPEAALELKPGTPIRFTLNVTNLDGGNARLLIHGDALPKGPVGRLASPAPSSIARANGARVLLAKVWHLIQTLDLSEREVRYLLTHRADFDDLDLGKLPTVDAGADAAALATAQALFAQFLRLVDYARLKRDLAGGGDDLIGVFEAYEADIEADADAFAAAFAAATERVAKLARCDRDVVAATATDLFGAKPTFKDERNLARLWDVLQAVQRFGVAPGDLFGWTRIVSPVAEPEQRAAIVADVKDAIKARFDPEGWQRVARPIFDALRRRQRDALVAHVSHRNGFASLEQLYEFFLIDPGMEPVVQTSRIRLAIGSLQLFVQRILLNLEPHVPPSVIVAPEWEWMKRYRVWEANRKIFLFPENWLEPEFRDDKTDLFRELEGTLLQGDVSADLVEDAFLAYLLKLDERARLDIAAMHLEEGEAGPVLHVIGRTFAEPRSHFYRRYSDGMWTPWEPITAEVEGDHLAPVVWRDRLYLFWVTFQEQATAPSRSGDRLTLDQMIEARTITRRDGTIVAASAPASTPKPKEPPVTELLLSEVKDGALTESDRRDVVAHLHWSALVNGEWSTRQSGGVTAPSPVSRSGIAGFSSQDVFVHVSTEPDGQPNAGVSIHLDGVFNQAFFLAGRNSSPELGSWAKAPKTPYGHATPRATRYAGGGSTLTVRFDQRIVTEAGAATPVPKTETILQKLVGASSVLPCNNEISPGGVGDVSRAFDPAAVAAAIAAGLPEIAALRMPIFLQDRRHSFFVEPTVEEQTIEDWREWIPAPPQPGKHLDPVNPFKEIPLRPARPKFRWPVATDTLDPIWNQPDEAWLGAALTGTDWLVNPGTGLVFEGEVIGPGGMAGLTVLPSLAASAMVAGGGTAITVQPGGGVDAGDVVVVPGGVGTESVLAATPGGIGDRVVGGLERAGGLAIVGGGGVTRALAERRIGLDRAALDLRLGRGGGFNG